MLLGGENYIVGFLRVMLTFFNPRSHRCCCWKNKVPGNLTSAKRIKWNAKAGLKKLKGIVGKMHAEEETLQSQFISCSSAYCLPGQHSRCNTQLAQLHFVTPIVSSGSVNKDFLNSLKPCLTSTQLQLQQQRYSVMYSHRLVFRGWHLRFCLKLRQVFF